jgi:hypothetical protein
LADKKYDEVDKVLEGELKKRQPSPEALRVSLDAAKASGRILTAHQRATRLLQVRGNADLDLVHEAAGVAALAGERDLALTRYLTFVRRSDRKDAAARTAYVYLFRHGLYPEEYSRFVKRFPADAESWQLGMRLFNELTRDGELDDIFAVADTLLASFKEAAQQAAVISRLRWASDNWSLGKEAADRYVRPLKLVLKHQVKVFENANHFYHQSYDHMPVEERVADFIALHALLQRPMHHHVLRRATVMDSLPSEAAKLDAGRQFLALEKIYVNGADAWRHQDYVYLICERPGVFNIKGKALVPTAAVLQKFDTVAKRLIPSSGNLNPLIHQLHHNYLAHDKAQRAAFLEKHVEHLDSQQFGYLLSFRDGEGFDALLARYRKAHSFSETQATLRSQVSWLHRLKKGEVLREVGANYLLAYPGNFDSNWAVSNVLRSDLIPLEARVKLLTDTLAAGGASEPLRRVAGSLDKQKAWQEAPAFQTFKKQLAANPAAKDPAAAAHVAIWAITQRQHEPAPAVAEAAKAFLAAYKGQVPGSWRQTTNVADTRAYGVFEKHGYHVWNRRESVYAWCELWAPRLGAHNDGWYWMVRRVREHGGGHTLFTHALKPFATHLKAGYAFNKNVRGEMTNAVAPRETDAVPMLEHYASYGWDHAIHHLYNHRSPWDPRRKHLLATLGKVAATNGFTLTDQYISERILNDFFHWTSREVKMPLPLIHALDKRLRDEEAKRGTSLAYWQSRLYGLLLRSGHDTEAAKWLADYLTRIQKLPPVDRVAALGEIYRHVGLPRDNDELKPGHYYHTAVEFVRPLVTGFSADERASGTVHGAIANAARERLDRKDATGREGADELCRAYVDMLVAGAHYNGHYPWMFSLFTRYAVASAKAGDWQAEMSILSYLAGILRHEGNWEHNYHHTIMPVVKQLEELGHFEIVFVFIDQILRRSRPEEKIAKQLSVVRSGFASRIAGLIPVDRTDPTYDLHVAAQALSLGNESRAWQHTAPKLKLMPKVWMHLPADYVAWSVEQMRKQKLRDDALNFCFLILLRERELSPEIAAQVSLTKGDIYRDKKNYQAARIEYEGLRNATRYRKTSAGVLAVTRLVDLLILTRDYATAQAQLERLANSRSLSMQAEAYFLFARMAYEQEEFVEAKAYLGEVFKRQHDHVKARLLDGELKLKLPRGLQETEVAIGNPKLKTIAIPARPLVLKLQDRNLSVARGGAAIPVQVTTSKGGDIESVNLLPSSNDKTLFVGTIQTALGPVKHNNLQLEVRGDDEVSYVISPEFQKANDLQYPPKVLEVKAPARLVASAGEILSEEEAEKREMERRLQATRGEISRRFEGRDGLSPATCWRRSRSARPRRTAVSLPARCRPPSRCRGPRLRIHAKALTPAVSSTARRTQSGPASPTARRRSGWKSTP